MADSFVNENSRKDGPTSVVFSEEVEHGCLKEDWTACQWTTEWKEVQRPG